MHYINDYVHCMIMFIVCATRIFMLVAATKAALRLPQEHTHHDIALIKSVNNFFARQTPKMCGFFSKV